ncbi:hypothetical protein TD95_002710, partial [Thielaviopsis punctulata]
LCPPSHPIHSLYPLSLIMKSTLSTLLLAAPALAANGPWAQCGGSGFSGPTDCPSGYQCVYSNQWYSQCKPGSDSAATTLATSTKSAAPTKVDTETDAATSTAASSGGSGFKWFGHNEAGAEFGTGIYPGVWGKDFTFPDNSAIATLIADGYNIFRIGFAMERMANTIAAPLNTAYLANLTKTVDFVTSSGAWAIVNPHNFGRFDGQIITDTEAFGTFWANIAAEYKDNAKVIFDTNNEYHDMDQTLVLDLNQAAINGIRKAGATEQYIMIEGNSYTGAWVWNATNDNLKELTDTVPNRLVYEMHQYLDSDGSGTHPTCVSTDIGVQRMVGATEWLRANNKVGLLGEFAGGANDVCKEAIIKMLEYVKENSDVWTGALWWSAGPWWGDYMFSSEPPSGTAYLYYNDLLKQYVA